MKREFHILLLEDSSTDAQIIEDHLGEAGLAPSICRVQTREDYVRALQTQPPDVILADYKLPHFDGRAALRLAKELVPQTPVIIVTGTLLDGDAVDLIHEGAADYVLKDRLSRLAPAVRRALAEQEQARKRQAVELALKNSELRYRRLFESTLDGILILEGDTGTIVDLNPFLADLIGYERKDLIERRVSDIGAVKGVASAEAAFVLLQKTDYVRYENLPLKSKSGAMVDVEVIANAYLVDGVRFIQCNIRDIRERVTAERLLIEQLSELRQFQKVTVDRELRMEGLEIELARLKEKGR